MRFILISLLVLSSSLALATPISPTQIEELANGAALAAKDSINNQIETQLSETGVSLVNKPVYRVAVAKDEKCVVRGEAKLLSCLEYLVSSQFETKKGNPLLVRYKIHVFLTELSTVESVGQKIGSEGEIIQRGEMKKVKLVSAHLETEGFEFVSSTQLASSGARVSVLNRATRARLPQINAQLADDEKDVLLSKVDAE